VAVIAALLLVVAVALLAIAFARASTGASPKSELPFDGTPEFPVLRPADTDRAWDILEEQFAWAKALRQDDQSTAISVPLTREGELVGASLRFTAPHTLELGGPWLLAACGPSAYMAWTSGVLATVGFLAQVEFEPGRVTLLVPLRLDGEVPTLRDLLEMTEESLDSSVVADVLDTACQ
jgi:hypothetical protein